MRKIQLTTVINAPVERVFDLTRSISLQKRVFEQDNIVAIHGRTTGLLTLRDRITWSGKFGKKKRLISVDVTEVNYPEYIKTEVRPGLFESLIHEQFFKEIVNGAILIDHVHFELASKGFSFFVSDRCVEKTIITLLKDRNALTKKYAEGSNWQAVLP